MQQWGQDHGIGHFLRTQGGESVADILHCLFHTVTQRAGLVGQPF